MQRFAVTTFAITAAAPALAHDGMHIHPHGDNPIWLGLMLGGLVLGCLALWAGTGK